MPFFLCEEEDLLQNQQITISRLNRHVKIEQLRTKFDEYSSFKLSVPEHLRTKVLDKHFWESDDIYVRNFVQKTRY